LDNSTKLVSGMARKDQSKINGADNEVLDALPSRVTLSVTRTAMIFPASANIALLETRGSFGDGISMEGLLPPLPVLLSDPAPHPVKMKASENKNT